MKIYIRLELFKKKKKNILGKKHVGMTNLHVLFSLDEEIQVWKQLVLQWP